MQMGLIGSGNMARALARGWAQPVLCTDGGSGRARALAAELGGEALESNAELAERCDVIVLCHKPAQLAAIAAEVGTRAPVVVSVLAATSTQSLREAYPEAEVVRAMPNVAVEVRRGVTCLSTGGGGAHEWAREHFGALGTVVELPEHLLDLATAVAGVAPAYVALVAEAQIDAAVEHGLPSGHATRLVIESIAGSADLLAHRDGDTLAVRREVSSPGGFTARGLAALERGGVRVAFAEAMRALVGGGR